MADLAVRYEFTPIRFWWSAKRRRSLKRQLLDNAARAFDPGGIDAQHAREQVAVPMPRPITQIPKVGVF